jgi:hypothetical protein
MKTSIFFKVIVLGLINMSAQAGWSMANAHSPSKKCLKTLNRCEVEYNKTLDNVYYDNDCKICGSYCETAEKRCKNAEEQYKKAHEFKQMCEQVCTKILTP